MKLSELISKLDYEVISGSTDIEISDVIYDTRRLVPNSAFVCIKGAKLDSHTLAGEAAEKGAIAIVCEDAVDVPDNVTVIKTNDTRTALAEMAAAYYGYPAEKLVTIGVTGSKGKTTTTYMIKAILKKAGYKTGLIGSIGALIGDEKKKTINTTPESYEVQ